MTTSTPASAAAGTVLPNGLTPLADAAQAYAALGWRVFPVQPLGKTPRFSRAHDDQDEQRACPGGHVCGKLGHGFKDATSDVGRVARWWARDPECNIGVATGWPGSPDVLDVDVKDGAPGRETADVLRTCGFLRPAWATSVTPSGGWHYWFDPTVQASATLKKKGIDFRATGGYVLAPPSVVRVRLWETALAGEVVRPRWDNRPYRWTSMDLAKEGTLSWGEVRDFLVPPPPPRNLNYMVSADHAGPIIAWFAQQPTGSRNNALFWAACRILESGYGEDRLMDLAIEAKHAGLADHEVRKTIDSAVRKILRGGA